MPSRHTPRLTRPDPGRELRTLRACGEQPLGITASGASSGHLLALVQLAGTVVKKQGPCTELYIKHTPKNIYAKVDEIPVISVD